MLDFPLVQLLLASVSLGLLALPVYWGNSHCRQVFSQLFSVWSEVRREDFDGGDTEWRRDLQHQLHQLLTSRLLTTRYCLYHLLSLLADTAFITLTLLYTRHFNYLDINLDSLLHLNTANITTTSLNNSFTNISCDDNKFTCDFSNSHIFFWFGALSSLIFLLKALVNLRGLGELIMVHSTDQNQVLF